MLKVRQARMSGEQYEAKAGIGSPALKFMPRDMTGHADMLEIVHAGAPERPVAGGEAGRLDQVDANREAGGKAQDRAGVLRNIGFKQGDAY